MKCIVDKELINEFKRLKPDLVKEIEDYTNGCRYLEWIIAVEINLGYTATVQYDFKTNIFKVLGKNDYLIHSEHIND